MLDTDMGFNTSLLDHALERRKLEMEKMRQSVLRDTLALLDDLTPPDISQAYIFGSLIEQYQFTTNSDVDIAVEELAPEPFFTLAAALSAALKRDVDLIELRNCHFADVIRERGLLWTTLP